MRLDREATKGLLPCASAAASSDPSVIGASIFEGPITWPLLTADVAAVSHNIKVLAAFCDRHDLEFAPHGKTTMAPDLFHLQVAAGAWGITVANVQQAAVCRFAGISRVLIANEVVDVRALRWIQAELQTDARCEILFYVDSVLGAQRVADVARAAGADRPLSVLIEVGYKGGRGGCRTAEQASAVAAEVRRSGRLAIAGVAAYEGSLQLPEVAPFFDVVKTQIDALHEAGAFDPDRPVIFTVGGSKFFDLVAEHWGPSWQPSFPRRVLLRSGAYVTHDDLYYETLNPFSRVPDEGSLRSALTLWAEVLSTPEPGLAIVGFGNRDAAIDLGLPVPRQLRRDGVFSPAAAHVVRKLNDQHAFVDVDEQQPLSVGDVIGFGVSHPCTSIDRWRELVAIDQDHRVAALWPTYF